MSRITNDASVERWKKYDKQTVVKAGDDGAKKVDHGASAVADLREAGINIRDIFDPTNHFRATKRSAGDSVMSFGMRILMIPWDTIGEIADVFTGPVKAVKNVGDAAVHGVMAGYDKVFGDD